MFENVHKPIALITKNKLKLILKLVLFTNLGYVIFLTAHRYTGAFIKLIFLPRQKWPKKKIWFQLIHLYSARSWLHMPKFAYLFLRVCLTYRCNGTCVHCYARGLEKEIPEDMKLEDFAKIVSWSKNNGWKGIRFVGGEPTCHPQFAEILNICYRKKMFVTMSTNNLFSPKFLPNLENFWNIGITVNYSAKQTLDNDNLQLFKENMHQLKKRNMPFGFAYALDYQNDNLEELFNDLKSYQPHYVRVTLLIPDSSIKNSNFGFLHDGKLLFKKMIRIQEECVNSNIIFYIFRSIPVCLLSKKEWQILTQYSSLVAITRCEIGYRGDYTYDLTVNPDLTIFPCPSIFVKGNNILNFKNRAQINILFKNKLSRLCLSPRAERCTTCSLHKHFIMSFENKNIQNSIRFFRHTICQGGCLTYKWNAQYKCS